MTSPLSVDFFYKKGCMGRHSVLPILRCGSLTRCSLRSRSVAQPVGVKGVKFNPPLRSWGPIFVSNQYCRPLPSKINENKQLTFFGGPMSGQQGSILSLRESIVSSRGLNLGPRGALRKSSGRKITSFLFRRGPAGPGGLPWLISPPLPELWLRHSSRLPVTQVSVERLFSAIRLLL